MNRRKRAKGAGEPISALFQNRPNALTQRGGDTVVMEYLMKGLESLGARVTLDLECRRDPADFDVVHLFNFATPDITRGMAERAHARGVPFVVTTLNEDVPTFHNQSLAVAGSLVEYVRQGQNREWYAKNRVDVSKVPPCNRFENTWTAAHAAALFSNGAAESGLLGREYPGSEIVEIKLGYEIPAKGGIEDFVAAYGVSDFVLCVGRLESRKNQLMLLKALEDSDLTVVLASGGFTYQPDYAEAVRSFKRKGRTIVLDRLSPEMLAGAYSAAKVHALPSWYELPGLVSLEAAYYGCNVVATARGTTADYFGDSAFYCEPSSAASIMNAVVAAYYSPFREQARAAATSHTWDETARLTLEAYERIAGSGREEAAAMEVSTGGEAGPSRPVPLRFSVEVETSGEQSVPVFDFSQSVTEFQDVLERGEIAARNRDYNVAHGFLEQASAMNPESARAYRARGAVFLAENNVARARECLGKASELDPADPKTLSGLAMCECMSGEPAKAYPYLLRALDMEPPQLIAILQLVECAYALNRYDDLERVLRRYLETAPQDVEMQYCLAGCLYKMGRLEEASAIIERVLESHPSHVGSVQLKELLDEDLVKAKPRPELARSDTPAPVPDIEFRLALLEDGKRRKQFSKVKQDCAEILASGQVAEEHKLNARLILAEIHALEGEISSSEEIYGAILEKEPLHARATCGKAAIAASRGEFDLAEELFRRAADAQPGYDLALAGLGLCAYARKDFEASWERYSEALAANPENSRALLGLIELGYRLGRLPQIEEALTSYLSMHPGDLNFIYSLAGCLYAQDKLDGALEEVEKILVFDSGHKHASELREVILSRRTEAPPRADGLSTTSRV